MNEQDQPLREVRSVWGQAEADVIKSLLESHGITCLFRGRVLQSIYPMTMDGLGEIKIFVTEKDYDTASSRSRKKSRNSRRMTKRAFSPFLASRTGFYPPIISPV